MQRAHATGAQRLLRPFPSPLRTGIRYLFFTLVLGAASARIVGDSSDEVRYTPPDLVNANALLNCATTIADGCANKWFSESIDGSYLGAVKSSQGPNASLQITFRGSIIVVKGVTHDRGARALMSLDNTPSVVVDTRSGDRQQHSGAILYSVPGLDPTVDHTLTIEYDPSSAGRKRPRLLRIDSFEIDEVVQSTAVDFPSGPEPSTGGQIPPPANTNTFPGVPSTTSSNGAGTTSNSPAIAGTTSSSSTVPIVAGLATGLATLVIASFVIWFLLRRRRAVRIQSMELPRSTVSPAPVVSTRSPPPRMVGLANLAYAFNRRGSSVGSSADAPTQLPPPTQALPPVPPPRINTFVSPYNYQRRGPAYPMSDATSSIGLPVDERPPNIPAARAPASPVAQSPRVLRVHNPGSSVVSSNAH